MNGDRPITIVSAARTADVAAAALRANPPEHRCGANGWVNHVDSGMLCCFACGAPWPGVGEALPVPEHERPGYGERGPSWRSRVDAMVSELRALDD